jgi:hypothetical protein
LGRGFIWGPMGWVPNPFGGDPWVLIKDFDQNRLYRIMVSLVIRPNSTSLMKAETSILSVSKLPAAIT